MSFTLAIVGRPNVGKSTLFNRMIGKKLALVDDQPGVTRDLREAEIKLKNIRITLVDTAGLEVAPEGTLKRRMSDLSLGAIRASDVCVFVIDARAGITAADETYASIIRKMSKFIILVANKVEGNNLKNRIYEAFSLGLGDPVLISAEHGVGIEELKQILLEHIASLQTEDVIDTNDEALNKKRISSALKTINYQGFDPSDNEKLIRLSIIGRPNCGKSTLINSITGNERLLTGPEAGITRDARSTSINWLGTKFCIFDTAGMRKKAKIQNKLEKMSVSDALKAVRFSEVIVLLVDINSPFDTQDLRIADLAEREGRCIVIAINKWDLEKDKAKKVLDLRKRLSNSLPQLSGLRLVTLSALYGEGIVKLHKEVLSSYKLWNKRVPTSILNDWLFSRISAHPPPSISGKRIKMRFITQVNIRPPSFVIFSSSPKKVPESYKRYLVNGLRDDFGVKGVPIRLMLRAGHNPYVGKSKNRR